jgi:hypothetical protein
MTGGVVKAAAISTFGSLAAFYWLTLVMTISSVGPTIGGAFAEGDFAVSFAARVAGGILSLLVVTLILLGRSKVRAACVVAWGLLLGVALILFRDTSRGEVAVLVSGAAILVHLWGAMCVQSLVSRAAF